MNVKVEIGHYYFKILINELPHFVMDASEKIIFHSWKDTETHCFIEFTTTNGPIRLEYDSSEKWKEVLKQLNENL